MAWWHELSGSRQPHVLAVREGSELIGLVPLYRKSTPWRTLRSAGCGPSDYLAPLCRPGYEESVGESLVEHLAEDRPCDLLDMHQIREGRQPIASFCAEEVRSQAQCCLLDLPSTFGEYEQTLSKSLRYEVRRLNKPPYSNGEAHIEFAKTPERAQSALSIFLDLHARRWRKRGLPGAFALGKLRSFHERFAAEAVESGSLWLGVLRHQGTPVGCIYGLKAGRTMYFYQSGFDPERKALSPGTVLVAKLIQCAIEEGCCQFDFLRGVEPYKLRWKPQHTLTNYRITRSYGGFRGIVGQAVNVAGKRIEDAVRSRLEGKGLLR